MTTCSYGFRIVGACSEERRLCDASAAFAGHAACDERAQLEREVYLSAFWFGDDFRTFLASTGSTKGFDGVCHAPWLWFDIDRADDLDAALNDARRLAHFLADRYRIDGDELLIFYSGSKGFHIGLPTALWLPEPATNFHRVAKQLAEGIASYAGVKIDQGVYAKVQVFRAPNSRHPKTGLHKRRLSLDELTGLSLDGIRALAKSPHPFDVPTLGTTCEQAKADWLAAAKIVDAGQQAKAQRNASTSGPTLNRLTRVYLREGCDQGDRHRRLYSAVRNLAEFGCPPALAHALLTEVALDTGLPPSEVRRQIDCGLKDQDPLPVVEPATPSGRGGADDVLAKQLADLWQASPTSAPPSPMPSPGAAADIDKQLADLWQPPAPPSPADAAPAEGDDQGDAWEHPLDRLGFEGDDFGAYGKQGGRR